MAHLVQLALALITALLEVPLCPDLPDALLISSFI
jgi:hypothetical protein